MKIKCVTHDRRVHWFPNANLVLHRNSGGEECSSDRVKIGQKVLFRNGKLVKEKNA